MPYVLNVVLGVLSSTTREKKEKSFSPKQTALIPLDGFVTANESDKIKPPETVNT